MDVAALTPLPVGIVPWQRPEPAFTVIVKATFRLVHGAEAAIAIEQQPLGLDEPYPSPDAQEPRAPSDFVPLKAKVDTLLVGHARASSPALALPGRLCVDGMVRSFVAVASRPATVLPLVSRYLRESTAPDARSTRLGPRSAPSEPWWGHMAERSCDFSRFNVAPSSQQIDLLRTSAVVRLENVLPDEPICETRLPGMRPAIFYCPWRNATELGQGVEVLVRADTLWIDADASVCTVTWRGVSLLHAEHHPSAFVAVAMRAAGETTGWAEMARTIATAHWVTAVEPGMLRVPPAWQRATAEARELPPMPAIQRTGAAPSARVAPTVVTETMRPQAGAQSPLPFSRQRATEPTRVPASAIGADRQGSQEGTTGVIDVAALRAQRALPFAAQDGLLDESTSTAAATQSMHDDLRADRTPQSAATTAVREEGTDDSSIEPDPPTPRPTGSRPAGMRLGITLLGGPSAKLGLGALGAAGAAERNEGTDAGNPRARDTSRPASEQRRERGPEAGDDVDAGSAGSSTTTDGHAAAVASTSSLEAESAAHRGATTPTARSLPSESGSSGRKRPVTQMTMMVDPDAVRSGPALPFTSGILGQSLGAGHSSITAPPPASSTPALKAARTGTVAFESVPTPAPSQPTPWSPTMSPGPVVPAAPSASVPASGPRPPGAAQGEPRYPPPPVMPMVPPVAWPSTPPPAASSPSPPERGRQGQQVPISIETYAQIKAELWRRPQDLTLLLERHGIAEAAWRAHEREQERALGDEAADGKADLALRLRRALLAAKAALPEESAPELTLDEYVALRVELDNAEDTAALLQKRGMTSGQWHRLRRHWQQRSLDDPALARELRAKLAESRRKHGEG